MQSSQPRSATTGERRRRTRLPRRLSAMIAASGFLVVALPGCAGAVAEVHLPATVSPTSTAATSAPATMMPPQQALAAVSDYTTALRRAEGSRNVVVARELLQPYVAAGRIGGLVEAMNAIWARGESFSGQDIRHVLSVTVAGQHAVVHDCDNTSGMGLVDLATGQIVPGSAGASHVNLVTHLDLVGGRWLVQFQLLEDLPCLP